MALSLQLVQKQTQRLIMTPQMQQSIQLLQLNSLELEQMVEEELLENPFLEDNEEVSEDEADSRAEAEPTSADTETPAEEPREPSAEPEPEPNAETSADSDSALAELAADPLEIKDAEPAGDKPVEESFDDVDVNWEQLFDGSENTVYTPPARDEEETDFTQYTAARTSLTDHLDWQLRLSTLEGTDLEIGEYLIGCLDEDGYLSETVERISEETGYDVARVEHVLQLLQTFDPNGVFARNLPESLLIQLDDLGKKTPFAVVVLTQHFELLQKKRFRDIARLHEVDEQKVASLFNLVRRLEPKPGRCHTKEQTRYITPDVYVKEIDGDYIYSLNEGHSSGLRISKFYRNLLTDNSGTFKGEEREYARERLRSAVMLMKNIEKRKSTILRVTEAIMDYQSEFLTKGVSHLRPLTLREIAEVVGMHEATISRVTSGKYVETPQGLYELKFFFSSGIASSTGEATSSRAIKELIVDMIEDEQAVKPLSDEKLAKMIHAKGFKIARRTVAKYREQLKILPAKLRRESS